MSFFLGMIVGIVLIVLIAAAFVFKLIFGNRGFGG